MTLMMTRRLRRWLRLADAVVILAMTFQPVAPAVILSEELSSGDEGLVTEAAPTESSDAKEAATKDAETVSIPAEEKPAPAPVAEPVSAVVGDGISVAVPETPADTSEGVSSIEGSSVAPVTSEASASDETEQSEALSSDLPTGPTVDAEGEASTEREPTLSGWKRNDDGSRTIHVSEGEEYSYPDSGMKITFTRIDADKNSDNAREITVKEVKLTEEQAAGLNALSDSAWDITSTMENGTFEYELTLPIDRSVDSDRVRISYAERVEDLASPESSGIVDPQDVTLEGSSVTAENVNHFTVILAMKDPDPVKVNICHATGSGTNPYTRNEVNINSVSKCGAVAGHGDHDDDIIPPYSYGSCSFSGRNWDAEGRSIWNNGCKPVPKYGTLVVRKTVDDAFGGGKVAKDFSFSVNGAPPVAFESDGENRMTVEAGKAYSVTEVPAQGYEVSYAGCSGVVVPANGSAVCSVTNTAKPAKLAVCKFDDEDGDGKKDCGEDMLPGWTMTVSRAGATVSQGVTGKDGCVTFDRLAAGSYTVTESQQDGWHDTMGLSQEVTLSLGGSASVSFGNQRLASMVIHKDVVDMDGRPVSDADGVFQVTVSGSDGVDRSVSLRDGEQATINGLVAGAYTVDELMVPDGYELVSVNPDGSRHEDGAQVRLDPGKAIHVFVVNRRLPGHIVIEKRTDPGKDRTYFRFDASWTKKDIWLSDGGRRDSGELADGTYSVRETESDGWALTDATCTGDGNTPSSIRLHAGETVVCTFTNTRLAKITIRKDARPNDSQDFTFTDNFGNGNPSEFMLDDDGSDFHWFGHGLPSERTFEVKPGDYSVKENEVAGWKQAEAVCTKEGSRESMATTEIVADPGDRITCTFTNKKLGKINLMKKAIGSDGTFDFSLTGFGKESSEPTLAGDADVKTVADTGSVTLTTENGTAMTTFADIDPDGAYGITENVPDGWDLTDAYCVGGKNDHWHPKPPHHRECGHDRGKCGRPDEFDPSEFGMEPGGEVTCTFENTRDSGTITVNKVIDRDGDLKTTDDRIPAEEWEFDVTGTGTDTSDPESAATDTRGSVSFGGLKTGSYDVSESLREGYEFLEASCVTDGEDGQGEEEVMPMRVTEGMDESEVPTGESEEGMTGLRDVSVTKDRVTTCTFVNAKLGVLSIEKENDASAPKKPGEIVRYRLKVKANEGVVRNVSVTDLPPEVATYVAGSWSAESSEGLAHIGALALDHEYHSPGVWDLGSMTDGEEITLEYDALVDDGTDAGDYPDLAYAQGIGQGGNLYAMAGVGGNIGDSRYVGTAIAVADTDTPDPAEVKTDFTEKEQKVVKPRVLGATLPETGSSAFWMLLAVSLVGLGAVSVGVGYGMRGGRLASLRRRIGRDGAALLLLAVMGGATVAGTADAGSVPDLYLRAEKPKATANGSFSLDYVVLDTDKSGGIEVVCQVKKPGESAFTTFQTDSISNPQGGNSGQCVVGTAELADDGSYVFRVSAVSGSEEATSDEYPVSYDSVLPGRPKSIDKSYVSSCTNRVKLRTADDGQTTRVEVYRSMSEDFTADASTLVHAAAVGPNATYEYDDDRATALCDEKVYYAVRAFDDAGNASPVREEDITETNRRTVYEDAATTGTVTLNPGAAGAGGAVAEGTGAGETTVTGEVAGEQAGAEQGEVEGVETTAAGWPWWAWAVLVAGAGYVWYRVRAAIARREKADADA